MARLSRRLLCLGLAVLAGGCAAADDRPDAGADMDAARPPRCSAAFGAPAPVALDRVGDTLVAEGKSVRATNIVKVAPAACQPLGQGLSLALLRSADVTPANEDVRLVDRADEEIFCGCPLAQHALCDQLRDGDRVRIRGPLSRKAEVPACSNQIPCYRLQVQAVCLVE
jgi:hypothetical protein